MKKIVTLTMMGMVAASTASAFQFEVTENIKGSLDAQATVGAGIRLNDPKASMVGDPRYSANANTAQWSNGDDGNLNYRKGDAYTTYLKLTPELLLQFPEKIKLMSRGTLLYDFMATETARSGLPRESRDQVARDYRLLDLWVSKEFDISDQTARIRVGNQVISWGESIFSLGGINQTNAMDIQKLMIPGTQLKEAVIPAPMISFSTGLGKGLNLEAYYQWEWNRNRMPPVGSYWSIADVYDRGKSPIYTNFANTNFGGLDRTSNPDPNKYFYLINGTPDTAGFDPAAANNTAYVPFSEDRRARGQGQFGVALHYKPEGLQLDLGFYFMNYHDKMPVLNYNAGHGAQWQFLEDRQMYGVSANFPVGNVAVGWEYSYRPKEAVALSACGARLSDGTIDTNPFAQNDCKGWVDTDKHQMILTGLLMLTPGDHGWLLNLLGADSGFIAGEAVGVYFPGLKKMYASGGNRPDVIANDGSSYQTYQVPAAGYMAWMANSAVAPYGVDKTVTGAGTKFSAGYTVDFNWTYDGTVIPGWQVTPGVTFFHALVGDTPTMLNNYAEGAKSTNAYILFNMNPLKWQGGINYAKYFGGAGGQMGGSSNLRQPLADRDFVGAFVTYNF